MTRCATLNDENGYDPGHRRRTLQPFPWSAQTRPSPVDEAPTFSEVLQRVRWDARSSANADVPHPRDQPPSACPMGPKIIGYLEANTGSQLPHRLVRWEAQTIKRTPTLRTATPEVPRNLPSELPIGQADGGVLCAWTCPVADGLFVPSDKPMGERCVLCVPVADAFSPIGQFARPPSEVVQLLSAVFSRGLAQALRGAYLD